MSARKRDEEAQALLAQLGAVVRDLRREKGLEQRQLAAAAGIPPERVGEVERGEVNTSVAKIWRIARGLGLTLSELFARFEAATGTADHTNQRRARTIARLDEVEVEDLHAVEVLVDALAEKQRRNP